MMHAFMAQLRTHADMAQRLLVDHIIAPPFCSYCKRFLASRSIFCASCEQKIIPVVSVTCPITQKQAMKVFAISGYCEPIRSLILAKSRSDIVASRKLGELLWEKTHISQVPFDYVIPIPLHWSRYARRGFNQAEEMAFVVSRNSGKPITSILQRTKKTVFQSSLPTNERHDNVADAFTLAHADHNLYRGKHLLLVDDLMTTGSTLKTAARQLYKLKPASISAVVAARIT